MNRTISKALSNPVVGILVLAICIIVLGFSGNDAFARRGGGRGGSRGGKVTHRGGRGSVSHHRSSARTPQRRSRQSFSPSRAPQRRPQRTPERSRERFQERRDVAREGAGERRDVARDIRSERRDVAREIYDERWDRARRYAFWRTAVVGTRLYARPLDCTEVFLSGWTYYNCGGVTWRPYMEGDRVVYVVVE
ncbi:MAG: hypothetical protein O7B35_08930 [Deltaproteobacteria bacterium]|nr:hypothetical protein [Deltaproteobacteria bacterium]